MSEQKAKELATRLDNREWLRSELGITDPTRDMTALWAAFREGQRAS